jgi:hypothetical protein
VRPYCGLQINKIQLKPVHLVPDFLPGVTEAIIALKVKLHWFDIPIDGPADVYTDNYSVVRCTRDFDTTLHSITVNKQWHQKVY